MRNNVNKSNKTGIILRWSLKILAATGLSVVVAVLHAILREFFDLYPWADLVASGLWLGADAKRKLPRRPNTQFCGKGTVGRIPKTDRKSTEDKFIWGWCEPVLIPTFDNLGQLNFPVAPFVLPAWQPGRRGRGAGVVGSEGEVGFVLGGGGAVRRGGFSV